MGQVYSAYDPELDRRVALKLLHTARGSDRARRLLAREARALGKLSHANVVQVYDAGEHEGDVFVAMELVEGLPLDAWCRRSPKPSWQEILQAYLDAAQGLSAAHLKGLVHRDVKPSNILRGNDGRVCVADFGLAAGDGAEAQRPAGTRLASSSGAPEEPAPVSDTIPARAGSSGAPDGRLTATGALLGTPLYMAPEQHEGVRATAQSDQYSLCVALYEGLFGALPFLVPPESTATAAVLAELHSAKCAGPPAGPPSDTPVPLWIHRALARGIAPDPADRYPSMDALIAALRSDPNARGRFGWRHASLGAAAAALVALGVASWSRARAFDDPCDHPERQLEGAWDAGVEARVRAAFLGTNRSDAEGTLTRVVALLDRYGADWSAMRHDVCVASGRGDHRSEILGLRDACLDRRRSQLEALATLFAEEPSPQVLDKAVQAASGLYPIASCADIEALTARVRPPDDPALRARVAALEPLADRLEVLDAAGKFKDGLAFGAPLLAEVRTVPYAPLRAEVEYGMGLLWERAGDYEQARALLLEAATSAAEGRDDVLVAKAWVQMLYVVGERQQRFDEAAELRALGPIILARLEDTRVEGMWLMAEGVVLQRMAKYAEAKPIQERAVAVLEKTLGADHPDVGSALNNLANTIGLIGDFPLARATHERALALREKARGPDHPSVATSLNNLGAILVAMGDYPRGRSVFERSAGIRERAHGPSHPALAEPLNNLGDLLRKMGELPLAESTYERTLAIQEAANDANVAYSLTGLGRVKVSLGQLDAALPLLERARTLQNEGLRRFAPLAGRAVPRPRRALSRAGRRREGGAAVGARARAPRRRARCRGPAHPGDSALAARSSATARPRVGGGGPRRLRAHRPSPRARSRHPLARRSPGEKGVIVGYADDAFRPGSFFCTLAQRRPSSQGEARAGAAWRLAREMLP